MSIAPLVPLTGWVSDGAGATDLRVIMGTFPDGSARVWECNFDGYATLTEVRNALGARGLHLNGDFIATANTLTWNRTDMEPPRIHFCRHAHPHPVITPPHDPPRAQTKE